MKHFFRGFASRRNVFSGVTKTLFWKRTEFCRVKSAAYCEQLPFITDIGQPLWTRTYADDRPVSHGLLDAFLLLWLHAVHGLCFSFVDHQHQPFSRCADKNKMLHVAGELSVRKCAMITPPRTWLSSFLYIFHAHVQLYNVPVSSLDAKLIWNLI